MLLNDLPKPQIDDVIEKIYISASKKDINMLKKFIKTVYKNGNGLLFWNSETVEMWMKLAVVGLMPMTSTHILLSQYYKACIDSKIFRFSLEENVVRVLVIGAAASPYFVQCADSILGNCKYKFDIISFDPQLKAFKKDLFKHYNEICSNYLMITENENNIELFDKHDRHLLLIGDYLDSNWMKMIQKSQIIILPTCIYPAALYKEYLEYIFDISKLLHSRGIFVIQIDYVQNKHQKIKFLVESLELIGFKLIHPATLILGKQDFEIYNYSRQVLSELNIVYSNLKVGANQIIFIFEKNSDISVVPVQSYLLFKKYMEEYYI